MKTTTEHRHEIRSAGLSKLNRITRAAAYLDELKPAFALWAMGEIYICRKTGDYRFRFGERSKSVTPWSGLAKFLFRSVEEFAFAALIFAEEMAEEDAAPSSTTQQSTGRVNVLEIAAERRAA